MSKGIKIAIIGGGSSYTPELIEGFVKRAAELPVRELWLADIAEGREKLEIIGDLARRMVKKAGVGMRIETTLDRKAALKDAGFVTTQFRVGRMRAREKDELIPAKHGVIGQETNGPGGLFKALRTIPVILEIVKECEALCPDAWIINFTNPAGIITQAVLSQTNWKRFVGLCNSPFGIRKSIGELLSIPPERLRMDFAGLNHLVFGLRTYLDGVDVSRQVLEKLCAANAGGRYPYEALPYTPEFIRALGCIPGPYLRYYFLHDRMRAEMLESVARGESRSQVAMKLEETLFERYKEPSLDVKPPELEKRGGAFYSEVACDLMSSIYNDRQDIQVVNTQNNGAVMCVLPQDVVECSCVITKEGPRPIALGQLPLAAEGIVQRMKAFEKLAVKAAVSGCYADALMAMTCNPLVQDERVARRILDEMLFAHREYLPQFFVE